MKVQEAVHAENPNIRLPDIGRITETVLRFEFSFSIAASTWRSSSVVNMVDGVYLWKIQVLCPGIHASDHVWAFHMKSIAR